ncbi:MAG: FAD-linked oxidase C-terminal domain-containing protein [Pyrobaculum sp.]
MKKVVDQLVDKFKDRAFTERHILALYGRDASFEEGIPPLAVVQPQNVEEVKWLVKFAVDNKLKLLPVGSSTSLSGNAVVKAENTVIVSMEKVNSVVEVQPTDWYAVVQAGVRVDELNLELARHGLQWPVDPASSRAATVGGVVSNGGGGLRGARYGPASHWVLGLEVVIGTGEAIRVGCRTVKCREGYNLTQIFVGSEGTLGIITEAVLRLAPLPQSFVGLLARFKTVEDLVDAVVEVRQARLWPMISEFLDDVISEVVGLGRSFHLWIGVDVTPGGEKYVLDKLAEVVARHRGEVIQTAYSLQEFNKVLEPRRRLYSAQLQLAFSEYGPDAFLFIEDVAVPVSKLPEAVRSIGQLGEKYGVRAVLGGHIGDGNLHPAVWARRSDKEQVKKIAEMFHEIGRIAIRLGGTISAEHGIGVQKKELLREAVQVKNRGEADAAFRVMKELKKVFDPHGVFNPGKVL